MIFNFSFNPKSNNSKTGPIPVTRTSANSCPSACPLKNAGCYAEGGPTAIHWKKINQSGISFDDLIHKIAELPPGQLWRHNEAGDLPGENNVIDTQKLLNIAKANKGKKGFTYTHYPLTVHNGAAIACANAEGFTVNVSANSLSDADNAFTLGLPTVAIVRTDKKSAATPAGNTVVICPAQLRDGVTCADCRMCQNSKRKFIIGFLPHGFRKNKIKTW